MRGLHHKLATVICNAYVFVKWKKYFLKLIENDLLFAVWTIYRPFISWRFVNHLIEQQQQTCHCQNDARVLKHFVENFWEKNQLEMWVLEKRIHFIKTWFIFDKNKFVFYISILEMIFFGWNWEIIQRALINTTNSDILYISENLVSSKVKMAYKW